MEESRKRHKQKQKRKKPYYRSRSEDYLDKPTTDDPKPNPLIGCTGKRRYPDIIAAHAAADHMSELINSSEVYLYLCEHCGGYHLTKAKISPDGKLNRWAYFFGKD